MSSRYKMGGESWSGFFCQYIVWGDKKNAQKPELMRIKSERMPNYSGGPQNDYSNRAGDPDKAFRANECWKTFWAHFFRGIKLCLTKWTSSREKNAFIRDFFYSLIFIPKLLWSEHDISPSTLCLHPAEPFCFVNFGERSFSYFYDWNICEIQKDY